MEHPLKEIRMRKLYLGFLVTAFLMFAVHSFATYDPSFYSTPGGAVISGLIMKKTSQDENYVASIADSIIQGNPSVDNITYTIPDASADNDGKVLFIRNLSGSYNIDVQTTSGQNIEAGTPYTLLPGNGFIIYADNDNSQWWIIDDV